MLHFHDRATFAHALTLPDLPALIRERITALADELIDWTEYLVIEPGDTEEDIVRLIGFSPLVDPIDGARFGEPGFHPAWDWLAYRDGWYEIVFTFGSTFAYVLFFKNDQPVVLTLPRQFRRYAGSTK